MRTRLTLPLRFNSEKRALGVIRDNGLFSLGAQVIELEEDHGQRWRIVIDCQAHRADAVARYLKQGPTPGVDWQRTELA